jgi:hypothetical protein
MIRKTTLNSTDENGQNRDTVLIPSRESYMNKVPDTCRDLLVIRQGEGIQLVKPETISKNGIAPYPTVGDLLNVKSGVYLILISPYEILTIYCQAEISMACIYLPAN